jgi:mannose-6-phosphate isomerase
LAVEFPGDVGVLGPLFLNVVHLSPGEAIYQKAGELHAYLEGTGIELMANSDNVLRGGLTPKHIDVKELLSVLAFEPSDTALIQPVEVGDCLSSYQTPTAEFRLGRIHCSSSGRFHSSQERSVEILLCVAGVGTVAWSGASAGTLKIGRGDSFLVPAGVPAYELSGSVDLFRADVPLSPEAG